MIRSICTALMAMVATVASAQEAPLLNSATADQLASLDHVDAGTAERIVALRSERGRLGSVEELRVLPGMQEDTLASLRHNTRVEVQMAIGDGQTFTTVDQVLSQFDGEPTVQQVQRWAESYSKTNPELLDRWLGQSQSFAVLPRLRVAAGLRDGFDQDFKYYTVDGVIDDPNEAVFDVLDDAGRDLDRSLTVTATWDLPELIMSSERIRVINEAQDIAKLRDKLLDETTRLYFERRRVQVDLLLDPSRDLATQTRDYLRLMELTANLDALTGGQFSRSLVSGQ